MPYFADAAARERFWSNNGSSDVMVSALAMADESKMLTGYHHKTMNELSAAHGGTDPQLVSMYKCLLGEAMGAINWQTFQDMDWVALVAEYMEAVRRYKALEGNSRRTPNPSKVLFTLERWNVLAVTPARLEGLSRPLKKGPGTKSAAVIDE